MIYFIFILGLLFLSFFDLEKSKYNRLFYYVLSIIIIVCFSGLRWHTGTDWDNYYEHYLTEENYQLFEPGYVLFVKFSKAIFNNYTFFLVLTSSVILFFIGRANFKLSPYPIFSMFIFISLVLPFWVRQTFSLAIAFYAFYSLANNNKKQFYLLVLLAISFHFSAIIILPLVLFYDSILSAKRVFLLLIGSVIVSKLNILSVIIDSFLSVFGLNDYLGLAKLSTYLTTETINENIDYGFRNLISMINIFLYVSLFLFFRKKIIFNKKYFNIFFNIYLFGAIINLISMGNIDVLRRFSMFFSIAPVILFPILIQNINDKYFKVLIVIAVTIISFGRYYGNLSSYWSEYYPYISIFNKVERR